MIFQYNDIIPQHCVLVKFLNKNSVKNNSEKKMFDGKAKSDAFAEHPR